MGFDLYWTASDGSEGTTSFSEPIIAPDFDFSSYTIDDSAAGNGGGTASPGETVDMTMTINNVGHLDAQFIHGTLSSHSPYITILQEGADFPDIPQGGSGSSQAPPFSFMIADNAPEGQPVTFDLALTEQKTFYSEVLTFDVMISSCGIVNSLDVPVNIPDSSTVESTLDYPDAITISEVNVFVDIKHTYIGDLDLTLVSPVGTTVLLHNNSGGGADNIFTWYDTETQPAEPLSKVNGENSQGIWKLRVEDSATGDTGTIDDWKLEVCGNVAGSLPYLTVSEHSMDDTGSCDPDGYADVGETVTFHVTIENTGAAAATGVMASLSSPSPMEALNNPVILPDINAGMSEVADFQVRIGAVSCMENATFNVSATTNEGVWGSDFTELLEVDDSSSNWSEDLELGGAEPAGWTHEAIEGTDDWRVVTSDNHTPGGQWSWFSKNHNKRKDVVLITPTYDILVGGSSTLEFWHWGAAQRWNSGTGWSSRKDMMGESWRSTWMAKEPGPIWDPT
jgi:subtilisin-like proprotein convertase family protein